MTEIERKALALVNEVSDGFHDVTSIYSIHTAKALRAALCRAIEQHEAFRREVSDAVEAYVTGGGLSGWDEWERLKRLILPKPDPLVEALNEALGRLQDYESHDAKDLRAALAARGLKIVEDK